MNWSTWLKGLAAVAIGGAATGAAQAVAGGAMNRTTALTAGIGALSTVLAYLYKSPLLLLQQEGEAEPAQPGSEPATKPAPPSAAKE
jgi:hypothetical protein